MFLFSFRSRLEGGTHECLVFNVGSVAQLALASLHFQPESEFLQQSDFLEL
jgi:hypothetical protein